MNDQEMEKREVSSAPKKGKRVIGTVIAVIVILLVVLGGTAALGWEVYVKRSDSSVIRAVTNVLPIPAARLGSRVVLYRDFVHGRDTLKKFLASPAAKEEELNVAFDIQLEQNVLEKLLVQQSLEELADQKKITVSGDELRQAYAEALAASSSTSQDPSQYLYENFGWDEEDFRQNVLRPILLEQKLTAVYAQENATDTDALNRAVATRMEQKDVVRYVRF